MKKSTRKLRLVRETVGGLNGLRGVAGGNDFGGWPATGTCLPPPTSAGPSCGQATVCEVDVFIVR